MDAVCLVMDKPELERHQATRTVRRSLALLISSGFPSISAEGGSEARGVQSGCRLSGTGITWAGKSPGISHGKVIKSDDQEFRILRGLGRASGEVRKVQWRRVVCSIERLRERQEAAGNGLRSWYERGGCLLFARRNGWASVL
jgi:hypothetical protein